MVLKLNFYQLEIFCAVVKAKSISKAARKLHLSQPAVSQQIQAMEQMYNVKLFNRSSQGVKLTKPGELVYEYSQKILSLFNSLESNLDKLMGAEDQDLFIGAGTTIGNYSVPCSLWAFKEKNSQANIKLDVRNSNDILQGVLENQYDLGLVEGEVKSEKVIKKKIHEEPLKLITPNIEPWSKLEAISAEQLINTPIISREKEAGTRKAFNQALSAKGIDYEELKIITEMTSISAIKSAVQAGHGISYCPHIAVKNEIRQGSILALPLEEGEITVPFYLIYLPEKFLSSIATKFIRFVIPPDQRQFC